MGGRGSWRAGALAAGLLAVLVILVGIPLNVISGYFPAAVTSHRVLWTGLLAAGVAAVAALTLVSRWLDSDESRLALTGQAPTVPGWVDRAELGQVVAELTVGDGPVALTTGLVGAGGFGKTTIAARACRDPKVIRRYRGGVVWVTVGRDTDEAGLAARISETIRNLGGDGSAFTNLEQAGQALAAALAVRRQRMLLEADDVWTARQLAPFSAAGQAARLLVTTRRPRVLDATGARQIEVDAVTGEVARRILGQNLPPMRRALERELLDLAGGWPLLLGLINRRLAADLHAPGGDIEVVAADAARRLRREGRQALDVADTGSREGAVAATVNYSLEALEVGSADRFWELGIFAEDAEVPLAVVGLLWQGMTGLSLSGSNTRSGR